MKIYKPFQLHVPISWGADDGKTQFSPSLNSPTKKRLLIRSPDILHKSVIGGVHPNLDSPEAMKLADCILAVAKMDKTHPELVEIDMNPVFAYPNEIWVVDAIIIEQEKS